MIIDVHTHSFPEKIAARTIEKLSLEAMIHPFTGGTLPELLRSAKNAGIDLSLILPVATSQAQVIRINDVSARINETYRGKGAFSLGCMHPDFPSWKEELRRIRQAGLRGIKLHPFYQDACIDDIRYLRIMEEAASLGLVTITHAGLDIGYPGLERCSPKMCRNVLKEIGPFPFVLAHMGGWRNWTEAEDVLSGSGVFLDTAFCCTPCYPRDRKLSVSREPMMPQSLFLDFVRQFGADHILFGTDSPWSDQKECAERIKALPLTKREFSLIMGENAKRLFHF